jgi:hypothetical protein
MKAISGVCCARGVRRIVKDRNSPDYVSCFIDDLVDSDGSLNWVEASRGSYG